MKFNSISGEKCCEGKQRFNTRKEAAERLSRQRKGVHQYHCVICGYWHNGSVTNHRKKVLARKAKKQRKLEKAEVYDDRIDYEEAA